MAGFSLQIFRRFMNSCSMEQLWTAASALQSNLYKTTTRGTTQKWLSWAGGRLIKHLYKTNVNQIW